MKYHDVEYYFFSAGKEWYWQQKNGVHTGNFHYEYLKGFYLGKTRIVPDLAVKLLFGKYDVYIKCINGRFALPITFLIALRSKKPFILWTGNLDAISYSCRRLFFPITCFIYRDADAVVVYGEHVKLPAQRKRGSRRALFVDIRTPWINDV